MQSSVMYAGEHTSTGRRGKPMRTHTVPTQTHTHNYTQRYKKHIITHLSVKNENLRHARLSAGQNVGDFKF